MTELSLCYQWEERRNTYLFLLLVEVIDDDADEQVEREERAEDDEDDKVDVHVQVDLVRRLLFHLKATKSDRKLVLLEELQSDKNIRLKKEGFFKVPLLNQLQHT